MAIDDPRAVQVVGRELAAHAVSGEDANSKAAHLPRHVPEHDVIVVELHAEHRIRQGLDHLALEFNLVLLGHCAGIPPGRACARTSGPRVAVYLKSNYQRERREVHQGAAPPVPLSGDAPRGAARACAWGPRACGFLRGPFSVVPPTSPLPRTPTPPPFGAVTPWRRR